MMRLFAGLVFTALSVASLVAADLSVPFEVAKALKVTRGKSFRQGLAFVDGRYIPPPYVVERHGNALRINGIQVTGQLIPWSDFLRTQEGAVVTTEVKPAEPAPTVAPEPEPEPIPEPESEVDVSDWDDPLADLFADEEPSGGAKKAKKKKKAVSRPKPRPQPKPVVETPTVVKKVELNGDFVLNDRAKALVDRINQQRTRVDAVLRNGGFICFGTAYSRVSGDQGAAKLLLDKLPEVMKNNSDQENFVASARASGLGFFPEPVLVDLFRNRLDYIKLVELRRKRAEKERMDNLLKESGGL